MYMKILYLSHFRYIHNSAGFSFLCISTFMEINDLFNLIKEADIETQECSVDQYKKQIVENTSNKVSINIVHLNIRSINKNFDELLILLESLHDINIDIIFLSETWNIKETKCYNIPGYELFYNNSKFNQNDGCLIYINNKITSNTLHIKYNNIIISRTTFKVDNIKFAISSMYRLPSSDVNEFINNLHIYLSEYINSSNIEILLGDININLLKENEWTNNYINLLGSYGFISYINKNTRVDGNTCSNIDHIFINKQNNNKLKLLPFILDISITDHYATSLNICFEKTNIPQITEQTIKKLDEDRFLQFVSKET